MRPSAQTIELPPRFRVSAHVADGGMASVWAAEDRTLGRMVAIKLLATRFLGDATAARRFAREARAAASLSSHPNVVTIFDVGDHDERPYIVMEYMAGGSIADVLRHNARASHRQALEWLRQAAGAIDAAHERGIVHRDVKPGNLLLDERRRLAVTDFGIASVAFDTTVATTGQVLGTAAYLSPEQAAGEPASGASDRYSLAVVGYELLTGKRPFDGDTVAAQARQHLDARPPAPSTRGESDLPSAVDEVLLRGLDKDPDARWPSAAALVGGLEKALARPAPARRPAREPVPTAVTLALPTRGSRPPVRAASRSRRRRWPVPAAVGALAAAAIAVLVATLGGADSSQRQAASSRPATTARAAQAPATSTAPAPAPQSSTPQATQAAPSASAAGATQGTRGVSQLNDEGFGLINSGRPGDAVTPLRQAVGQCGSSTELTCAYALFNLGHALRLAGRPDEAVPVLERRLKIPNQQDVVRQELEAARRAAARG